MTPTTVAPPKRIRVRNDHRSTGVVIDTDDDGRVMWVDAEGFCHFSAPDWVEVLPASAPKGKT